MKLIDSTDAWVVAWKPDLSWKARDWARTPLSWRLPRGLLATSTRAMVLREDVETTPLRREVQTWVRSSEAVPRPGRSSCSSWFSVVRPARFVQPRTAYAVRSEPVGIVPPTTREP